MQSLAMGLMILGAIGFWPLAEFKGYLDARKKKEEYKFTMFSRILIVSHLSLWIISAILVYIIEQNGYLADPSIGFWQGIYHALFMSLTTRNAGFVTMSMNDMTTTTQILFGILMFIGSSPNSAGGGIRTTTFLITILGLVSFARGREEVIIGKRSIKHETVYKSLLVFIGAAMLIVAGLFIMSVSESNQWFGPKEIFFELTSAFGTTGLSLGITSDLTNVGKIVLIVTMFVGRVGVLALLLIFRGNRTTSGMKYPEIDMIVG